MKLEDILKMKPNVDILALSPNSKIRREYIRNIFDDEELLKDIFIHKKYTVNKFNNEIVFNIFGIKLYNIYEMCEKYDIKLPTMCQAAILSKKDKEKTLQERYGIKHPMQKGSIFEQKRNNTVVEKYGVSNVFELECVKEKSKNTFLSKYGVPYMPIQSKKQKNRNVSGPHRHVSKILSSNNVLHKNESYEKVFCAYNEELGKTYWPHPDILIEEKKVVIEIYGDYWHCNPKIFKPNDLLNTNNRYNKDMKTPKDVWHFDEIRKKHIEKCGYKVIIIWESDIKDKSVERILKENGIL